MLNRDFDPSTGVPTITARSETVAKHAFALGQTTTPPPTPGVTGPLLVPVPADGAWTIVGTEIARGETTVPAIVIAGVTDSPVAETVVFEYRVVVAGQGADAGWQGAGEEPPTVTAKAITGIRPGAAYEAAVSYRRRGIVGDRRVLGPVQVGNLALDFDYVTGPRRPANNADVTASSTAKDVAAVAGRSAAEVLSGIDVNVDGILAQALRQDDLVQILDARTLVEGQPVGTQFLNFRRSTSDALAGTASALDFNGVFTKAANGTGYTMNLQAVKAGDASFSDVLGGYNSSIGNLNSNISSLGGMVSGLAGSVGTLTTNLQQVGVDAGAAKAGVTFLRSAYASPEGVSFARATLLVDASGRLAGFSATSDGTTGVVHVVADKFLISAPGAPDGAVAPFSVVRNTLYADNLVATTISYGALVQRFTDVGQQQLDPAGWYQVLPGGLIMQGGRYRGAINTETTRAITFPRPFPNQVLAVGANPSLYIFSSNKDLWLQNFGEPSLTGATFATQAGTKNNKSIDGFDWWAWGK